MKFFTSVFVLAFLHLAVFSASVKDAHTIYQFEDGTFIENIAARSGGGLLLTSITKPLVYHLDPKAKNPIPTILFEFPNATGMTGIAEVYPDVFAVVAGIWNLTESAAQKGSLCLWTLDVRKEKPVSKKIVCVPDVTAFNGATTLTSAPGAVFVSESRLGAVYRIDVDTGAFSAAIQDPLFESPSSSAIPLGINGIRTKGNTLYFANSAIGIFGKVPLTPTGESAGPATTIAHIPSGGNFTAYDDFALDAEGNAWIALQADALVVVTPSGMQQVVLGGDGSMTLATPTSATFGRGKEDSKSLYVTTAGFGTSGGQVVAMSVEC
ncbi:hypothetical protein DL96DRAFT_1460644 [Flagelloscypha sp. PMI_526]|nr:hypothetical protein DL96DRAFT_1460644 [Flagelloscypha sp. PMI_526]